MSTSAEPATCQLTASERGATLKLTGAWRLAALPSAWHDLCALRPSAPLTLDGSALKSLDAAAALALLRALRAAGVDPQSIALQDFSEAHRRVFEDVRAWLAELR